MLAMIAVAKPMDAHAVALACVCLALGLAVLIALHSTWPCWSWERKDRR